MATLSDRIRHARIAAGFQHARDASKAFGWSENTYRSAENGQRPPGRETLIVYARAFRVSLEWLLTGRGEMHPARPMGLRQIPIYRWEDVGPGKALRMQLLAATARGFVVVPEADNIGQDAFALIVEDNPMVGQQGVPFSLYPGDKLVIDPDCEPHPGNIVLAHVGGRAVVRKMRILSEAPDGKPQQVALVPLNPDFPTHEVEFAAVVGVVVSFVRDLPH